ncbi:MAG: DUF969 domain-containing protein [Opitutales bacterium]
MIRLIGILVVAAGFALRVNTLLVVMAAGIATGLVAGMSFNDIMALFGEFFVRNRYVTLTVVLMLPVVGLLERHGLRERAETLIKRARSATAGRVILLYTAVRQISIALGVNIGGHPAMVRPLVAPMAEAAALQRIRAAPRAEAAALQRIRALRPEAAGRQQVLPAPRGNAAAGAVPDGLDENQVEKIRAHAAAGENVGNFFGEDTVFAASAVLMIQGILDAQGYKVGQITLSMWGIPTALVAFGMLWWRVHLLDRGLARGTATRTGEGTGS